MPNVEEKLRALRAKLLYHAKRYYVDDDPEISDYEYDMMYAELLKLEAAHPEFFDPSSPSQRVGGKPLDKFEKVTHTVQMNSLSDVFSFEELREFLDRVAETVPNAEYSVEPKIDGLSVSLRYENGVFCAGSNTRRRLCGRGCHAKFAHHLFHPDAADRTLEPDRSRRGLYAARGV